MQYYELPRWVRDLPVYRPVCKWAEMPTHAGRLDDYVNQTLSAKKFNTEGEKQMEKIDWHKPLRALNSHGEPQDEEARTYKSGKQRVVWVDERVYPVDDQGRATAEVWYSGDRHSWPRVGALKGSKLVENAPEEKFFLGLYRPGNGQYEITDCGQTTTMGVLNRWKRLMADQPNWIVDTRKSAEPPKAIEHDPKDYVTIYTRRDDTFTSHLMTKAKAEAYVSEPGEQVVRVRTTPAPVDTSRYIQLWRSKESDPWRINKLGDGRQEYTWEEADKKTGYHEYVNVKVRD